MNKQVVVVLMLTAMLVGCKQSRPQTVAARESEPQTLVARESEPKIENSGGYELPAVCKDELIISHTGYKLSYNKTHNTPNWSAWCLTAAHTDGPVGRSRKFWADPSVPSA